MRHIRPPQMMGFISELEKGAGWMETLGRAGRRGVGALVGKGGYGARIGVAAGVGAATGGALDEENRLRGALVGGAVGGAGMGGAVLATKAGREWAGKGIKNFAARQRYSLTGGGASNLREAERIGLVQKMPKKMPKDFEPGFMEKHLLRRTPQEAWAKHVGKIKQEQEAFQKGYLNLPGIVRHPIGALKSGWQRMPLAGKALMGGLGAYDVGSGIMHKPEAGEPGRGERVARSIGTSLGAVAAPVTLGGLALSEGASQAGKWLGRGTDKLVGRVNPPEQQAPAA